MGDFLVMCELDVGDLHGRGNYSGSRGAGEVLTIPVAYSHRHEDLHEQRCD